MMISGNAYHDHLILWLAYMEAKALLGLATEPNTKPKNDEEDR